MLAYDAADLSQAAVFCASPNTYGAGIWASGGAPAVDAAGNIYVSTGNDSYNGVNAWGESVLKLSPDLAILDWFTPSNYGPLDSLDADVSSNRPLLVGGRVVIAGKDLRAYSIDPACMGHLQASNPACSLQSWTWAPGTVGDDTGAYGALWMNSVLYLPTTSGSLYAYQFTGGTFNPSSIASSVRAFGFPGPAQISGSSNGPANGIVWTVTGDSSSFSATAGGTLRALDPATLGELWNSGANARDALGVLAKFAAPVPYNGMVYVPTQSGAVAVYGLLPPAASSVISGSAFVAGSTLTQ